MTNSTWATLHGNIRKERAWSAYALVTLTLALQLGCYQGVGRSEIVEVVQAVNSPAKHTAQLVCSSSWAALSGNLCLVLIADTPYSVDELRKRFYSIPRVFKAGRKGLSLRWSSPNELTITCEKCELTPNLIEDQKFTQGDVKISYVGFPIAE